MDPDKYLQGIIDKHLRAKGIPHYSGPNTNLHQIPDHVKGEIDIILQTNPNIVTANISSYEKMQTKKIKEPEQQFKAEEYEIDDNWWEEKQENFDPFYTRTLKMRRDLPAIQRLAASENKSIQVTFSNGGRSGVNLADGIAFFDFHRGISNALKKVIILHEAAHLSITPHFNKLDPVDRDFVIRNQELINIIEDIRVNRYLCLKYPGLPRYFVEECQSNYIPFLLSIGDLCDVDDSELPYDQELIDEIRACKSFEDVLTLARKLVNQFDPQDNQLPDEMYQDEDEEGECEAPTGGEGGEDSNNKSNSKKYQDVKEDLKRAFTDEKTRQLFDVYDNVQTFDRRMDQLKTVIKPEQYFLGERGRVRKFRVPKSLKMLVQREIGTHRRTREGKLAKFDPIRLTTDKKIFQRKNREIKNPDAVMVIDMSGSMIYNVSQMRGLTHEMLKLFKDMNMKVKIYAHSGDSGQFHVSEIQPENITSLEPQNYTLDGSMLEFLYKEIGHLKKKPIVFYFSDGQMAVQYTDIQRPKITQYINLFEYKRIPIFGIGLNSRSVREFKHYYCVFGQRDLANALKKIAKVITRYRVIE